MLNILAHKQHKKVNVTVLLAILKVLSAGNYKGVYMPNTLNLAQRMKELISQESEIIQRLTKKQLKDIRRELNTLCQQELSMIKADIKRQNRSVSWYIILSRFTWPLIVGVCLSVGILGGSWGAMSHLTKEIVKSHATLSYLTKEIVKSNQTMKILENAGSKIQFSSCGNRKCVKINTAAPEYKKGFRIIEGY